MSFNSRVFVTDSWLMKVAVFEGVMDRGVM